MGGALATASSRKTFHLQGCCGPQGNKGKRRIFSNSAVLLLFEGQYQSRLSRRVRFSGIGTLERSFPPPNSMATPTSATPKRYSLFKIRREYGRPCSPVKVALQLDREALANRSAVPP